MKFDLKTSLMKYLIPFTILFITNIACSQNNGKNNNQYNNVGGSCEGCEAIYESPKPFDSLANLCWLPDWNDSGKRLAINGIVYDAKGKPAAGVIIYVYHTNQEGIYPTKGDEKGWAKRHGYIRGWMKTNEKGEYKFFTLRPGAYPGRKNPEHIHITIKEPGKNEYWIDEFLFEDDPILTSEQRQHIQHRGGNGIILPKDVGNMLKAERNIFLGKNIPNYPKL